MKTDGIGSAAAAVVVEQYRLLPNIAREAFADPWFLCFQMCVSEGARTILYRVADSTPNAKLTLFHDHQKQYQGRAVEAFEYLKRAAPYGERLGTCTPGSNTDIVQLQVADLVAYEVRKHIENAIYNPHIPVRWPMRKIQEMFFSCTYMDFTGRVPEIAGGTFSVIKRSTIGIDAGELKLLEWPVRCPSEEK